MQPLKKYSGDLEHIVTTNVLLTMAGMGCGAVASFADPIANSATRFFNKFYQKLHDQGR